MTQYNPKLHGTESKAKGSEELQKLWLSCPISEDVKRMGRFWPVEAIFFDNAISPRANGRTDPETVQRYSEILDQLPPIQVQRRTGQLIDGKHRLEATVTAGLKHIRVVEVDVRDDELLEAAFLANSQHGLGYTDRERSEAAKRIWDAKVAAGESPNQSEFAAKYGVSRRTVVNWAQAARGGTAQLAQSKPAKAEPPITITGVSGTVAEESPLVPADAAAGESEPEYAPPAEPPADVAPLSFEPLPKGHALFPDVAIGILNMADLDKMGMEPSEFLSNLPGGLGAQVGVNETTAANRWLARVARAQRVRGKADDDATAE